MRPTPIAILVLTGIVHYANGLLGPNVCLEHQNYTLTTRVKYQQPVVIRTYTWCLGVPPRCSAYHTEMREKWKVQTVQQSKTVEVCCQGFKEEEDSCLPYCPAGVTGDKCDKDCPLDRWGTSCHRKCNCPENSQCDVNNGKCICLEGWVGANCNILRDSLRRTSPIHSIFYSSKASKPLFDWSTPTEKSTNEPPKYRVINTTNQNYNQTTTRRTDHLSMGKNNYKTTTTNNVSSEKDKVLYGITTPKHSTTSKDSSLEQSTEAPNFISSTLPQSTVKKVFISSPSSPMTHPTETTIFRITTEKNTVDKLTISTDKPTTGKQSVQFTETFESTTSNMLFKTSETPHSKLAEPIESTIERNIPISQIESPKVKEMDTSVFPIDLVTKDTTKIENHPKTMISTTTQTSISLPTTTISTAKRKQSKIYKIESDILNITLHSAATTNETNSKIFKTVTLPTISNTTRKAAPPKGKYMQESKMITIPVRVIMDTGKVQQGRKFNSSWIKTDVTTVRNFFVNFKLTPRTYSPPTNATTPKTKNITEEPLEEIRHVLTEPEQITSVAGNSDSDERKEDLFSVLSIAAGVSVAIILTGFIIALVARCRARNEHSIRDKNLEMNHVQSMLSISEDDLSTGYMRNIYHAPLPDPPQTILDKSRFSVPFMQPVMIHAISPDMIENFRDILECHYDHPKPPRPTSFSPVPRSSVYELPPSRFSHLNTLQKISEVSNQFSVTSETEICLPVTDEAINVLKLEHLNLQHGVTVENMDPVYDEIPPWSPIPVIPPPIVNIKDEAVTEL